MLITVPEADLRNRLLPAPDGIDIAVWDMSGTPESQGVDSSAIEVVLVPHYFLDPAGYRRLSGLPRLRLVQLPSAGFEHALPFLPAGVRLANGRGVHDEETAELAIALVLASLRGIDQAVLDQRHERWRLVMRPSLADRRVTLVGFGSVGRTIARYLEPFGVDLTVLASSARRQSARDGGPEFEVRPIAELHDILPSTEVLILIVPSTPQTHGLVAAEELALLPDGALVVNVARGPVVETDALVAELRTGRIRAALDVTDPEPLPPGHPLWHTPNTLITPHVGGATTATNPRVARLMAEQLRRLATGDEPLNLVH